MSAEAITFETAFTALPEPFLSRYQDAAFAACHALAEVAGRLSLGVPDDQLADRQADIAERAMAMGAAWLAREAEAVKARPGGLEPKTDLEQWLKRYAAAVGAMQLAIDDFAESQAGGGSTALH